MRTTGTASGAQGSLVHGSSAAGLALAATTALVSGVSVFVNSYGVHAIKSPDVYTTAKNLVAFALLAVFTLCARRAAPLRSWSAAPPAGSAMRHKPGMWVGLAYVGVVGGGLAFVLFFNGLADTAAVPAAFWHDTLVVWVALLAMPLLGERIRWWNAAAIALLLLGQIALSSGVGRLAANRGEMLVLVATLLWSVEVVVAKRLLTGLSPATLALVRMGVGGATLLVYLAVDGKLHLLTSFGTSQVGWVLLTGSLLAVYVGTWMSALRLARAIDVSSILVLSVVVTALLEDAADTSHLDPQWLGLVLIAAGAGLVVFMCTRVRGRVRASVGPT
jgi:drug/metabolite transporter (DMT)-like permease